MKASKHIKTIRYVSNKLRPLHMTEFYTTHYNSTVLYYSTLTH